MHISMCEIRSRYKDTLGMALYILIYSPQCVRKIKVMMMWNPNRKNRSSKMVGMIVLYTSSSCMKTQNLACANFIKTYWNVLTGKTYF